MTMMAMEALKKEGINKVNLVAFTSNELGNGFWKNMGWTFRKDMNYYEFDLNPENVTAMCSCRNIYHECRKGSTGKMG